MTQVWNPLPAQLDALTEAKISVLRSKGANQLPALLHDLTAATNASDYTNLVRVRCMGVAIQTLLNRANKYIGQSSLDGLTLVSMQTQLTQDLVGLQTRGYCTRPSVKIVSTPAQQRIGHATLYLTCRPADELIQLSRGMGGLLTRGLGPSPLDTTINSSRARARTRTREYSIRPVLSAP
jgi:hypothetical protein